MSTFSLSNPTEQLGSCGSVFTIFRLFLSCIRGDNCSNTVLLVNSSISQMGDSGDHRRK